MSNILSVDRLEREFAVCLDDDRAVRRIPLAELPPGLREGDCLRSLPQGGWTQDPEEAARRRQQNRALFDTLRKKP